MPKCRLQSGLLPNLLKVLSIADVEANCEASKMMGFELLRKFLEDYIYTFSPKTNKHGQANRYRNCMHEPDQKEHFHNFSVPCRVRASSYRISRKSAIMLVH